MRPACHEVPQAAMMMRSAARKRSLLSLSPEMTIWLPSPDMRPLMQSRMVFGCSNISLSMKWG